MLNHDRCYLTSDRFTLASAYLLMMRLNLHPSEYRTYILYCIFIANEVNDESHYINNLVNWIANDTKSYRYRNFASHESILDKLYYIQHQRMDIVGKLKWRVHATMDVLFKIISFECNHWIWNRRRCSVHQGRQMKRAEMELTENSEIYRWCLNRDGGFDFPCKIENFLG